MGENRTTTWRKPTPAHPQPAPRRARINILFASMLLLPAQGVADGIPFLSVCVLGGRAASEQLALQTFWGSVPLPKDLQHESLDGFVLRVIRRPLGSFGNWTISRARFWCTCFGTRVGNNDHVMQGSCTLPHTSTS